LPYLTGVEVLGGPYLKAGIKTNFTQFGEGRLFGRDEWSSAFFDRYAGYYRPTAIICWSPVAVAFCQAHPELVEIIARNDRLLPTVDPTTGRRVLVTSTVIFGKIGGSPGKFVRGRGRIRAEPGRLIIDEAIADELDGLVVLSYHNVPRLRSTPPLRIESVKLGDDPVGFIGFRPPRGRFVLEMDFRP
jgi:hypothetical protein